MKLTDYIIIGSGIAIVVGSVVFAIYMFAKRFAQAIEEEEKFLD